MSNKKTDKFVGQVINNFEIQELIGQGGMGIVYRAFHPDLELYAAIKFMRPELASQKGFYERFLQEARTAARLGHPNIVDVINFGTYEDSYYLIMDYIEGPSLRHLIMENKRGLPLWDSVQIGWQIADVLVYSHAAGVLHRDLKPDNILLTHSIRPNRPYRAIVTDFGLVKLGQGSIMETQEGISVGTPAYMSPEQCQGDEVDGRTDIYALGVLLYETLVGQRPYPIRSLIDAAKFHATGKLTPLRAHDTSIPEELDILIQKMLVPSLDKRLASAAEATDALQEIIIAMEVARSKQPALSTVQQRIESNIVKQVKPPEEPVRGSTTPTLTPIKRDQEAGEQYFVKVAYQGSYEDKVYPIGEKAMIVGRLSTSDIVLDRPEQRFVSKRHGEILLKDNRVLIRDLGSTNGTVLGENNIQPNVFHQWLPGVNVQLGPFSLELKSEQELRDLPSPPADAPVLAPITRVEKRFRISCPNGVPSRLPLITERPVIIGRAIDCDMIVEHPQISKHHCRIQLEASGPQIVDLRSTNGTYLRGQRLPPHAPVPWRDDSTIQVGPFTITLEKGAEA